MKKILWIINSFLPWYEALIWVSIASIYVFNFYEQNTYLLLHILMAFTMFRAAVFIHELGHFTLLKLTGGKAWLFSLGRGRQLWHYKLKKGLHLVLRENIDSGLVRGGYDKSKLLKLRIFFYIFGGMFFNLLALGAVYYYYKLYGFNKTTFQFPFIFGVCNLALVMTNLVPKKIKIFNIILPNDGLTVARLLISPKEIIDSCLLANIEGKFENLIAEKLYEAAEKYFLDRKEEIENINTVKNALGILYLKKGEFEKALNHFYALYENSKPGEAENEYYLNNIAWSFLLLKGKENIKKSKETFDKINRDSFFSEELYFNTQAIIEYLNNNEDAAEKIIKKNIGLFKKTGISVIAVKIMGTLLAKKGISSEKYENFVSQNKRLLDKDEIEILNKI
ncbi:MAG: hypothetical protein OEZ13_05065 [Spirochaetia bacterium]|nr:hypothetical protein [Spirochaetia bacterium]